MKLINNAKEFVEKELAKKSTKAYYLALRESADRNYQTLFASNMQSYVTRIGLILAACYSQTLKNNTFLGSIDFICNFVLHDRQLYKLLRAIDVNDSANSGKHTLGEVNVTIKECLHQYNNMITGIISKTRIKQFSSCYLTLQKKVNFRDVPILDEKRHHIYDCISGFDFQIKLCPDYTVDQYKKTVDSKITVYWPKGFSNHVIDVQIVNSKNNKVINLIKNIDVSKENSKKAIVLHLNDDDLDRRVLKCKVNIKLLKREKREYSTGIIFTKWHSYIDEQVKGTKEIEISQFYSPVNIKK